MANLITVTVEGAQGFASTEPKALSAANIRLVRVRASTKAKIYYYDPNAMALREYDVTESLSTLKTAINLTDTTVNELTLRKIDGIHEPSPGSTEKILINDAYIVNIVAADSGTTSIIHYDLGKGPRNTELYVSESPAAVVAGDTSP
jgi:hypothetical protein